MLTQLPHEQKALFARMMTATVRIFNPTSGSLGTGVLISDRGLILTCEHVIKRKKSLIIRTCELTEDWDVALLGRFTADVLLVDKRADLAALLIRPSPVKSEFPCAEVNLADPAVEDPVYRIGMDSIPMDSGHVINLGKDEKTGIPFIGASIISDSGASGGPLFDKRLRLIGIVTDCTTNKKLPPIAYAVPTSIIRNRLFRRVVVKRHLPEHLRPKH